DASGNPVTTPGVQIQASIASGDGTLGGQAGAFTNDQGRADYTDLAIVGGPGARALRFASTAPASEVLSGTITLPSVAAVSNPTPPSPVVVGTRLVAPVSWTLTDAASQPVADAPVTISVSDGGSVEPVSTTSDPSGVVKLQAWTLSQVAGSQYVELQAGGTQLVFRVTVDALPDAAVTLEYTSGDDQSAPVDSVLPQALVVRVVDRYRNGVSEVPVQWATCDGIVGFQDSTDIGGYASAFQRTGTTPDEYCAMASSSGLADSPIQFSYTVTPGTAPTTSSSSRQFRAIPPAATRQHQRP
ncbi:MAG: hypothetical protein ABI785_00550, partial [Gemmatimonadales bacterium]